MGGRLLSWTFVAFAVALVCFASPASAKLPLIEPASYPDMTTFNCRTEAITLQPGQNLNRLGLTKACPNAERVSGPLGPEIFSAGSGAQGYMTRFQPSMVEIKPSGKLVTPAVWDLHLHHVVWLPPSGGTLAAGEEKTIATLPQGYGIKLDATANWLLVHMLHNLTAEPDRKVYLTWQIDWVPETQPARTDISPIRGEFMNVANGGAYPVFDAEREFDADGDGKFVFPDDVSSDPADASFEERDKISGQNTWVVPSTYTNGVTLLRAGGHLHPGGLTVDLEVARDGPDAGDVDGDDPSEVRAPVQLGGEVLRAGGRRELGRIDDGRRSRLADPPRARRQGLDQHDLQRAAGVLVRGHGDHVPRLDAERRPGRARSLRAGCGGARDVRAGGSPDAPAATGEHRRRGT